MLVTRVRYVSPRIATYTVVCQWIDGVGKAPHLFKRASPSVPSYMAIQVIALHKAILFNDENLASQALPTGHHRVYTEGQQIKANLTNPPLDLDCGSNVPRSVFVTASWR